MLQDNVVHHKFSRFVYRGPGQQKEDIKKHKLVGAQCAQDTPTVGTTPVKIVQLKSPQDFTTPPATLPQLANFFNRLMQFFIHII